MEPIRFVGQIRYWNPEKASGLAVVDVPAPDIAAIGGLTQVRVRGTIAAAAFVSNVMPAGGGRLALSVSKAMMSAAKVSVGDSAPFAITSVGGD
jgi:L-alanine-DL-glutamate epimerase-like enolase superfamily enzyme